VTFSHVLEHMLDPFSLLCQVAHHAPGARVYIEVPDAASYLRRNGVHWAELYFEHLSHFRRQNMIDFAERSGISIIKEGRVPFSRDLVDTKCLFLAGRFGDQETKTRLPAPSTGRRLHVLPAVSVQGLPRDDRPLAIWGVSQYAMLLLGSCPQVAARVIRLFDNSPAKAGRSIHGMVIEPAASMGAVADRVHLLIPESKFLSQMLTQLSATGFKGPAWVV
jgi:hypothetical protein